MPTLPAQAQKETITAAGLVNGEHEEAILDSGFLQSAVLPGLLPREWWSEAISNISCVYGDEKWYPIAEVNLTVGVRHISCQ